MPDSYMQQLSEAEGAQNTNERKSGKWIPQVTPNWDWQSSSHVAPDQES